MLTISTILVWVRKLVRVIEFARDFYGFVNSHEAMLQVFRLNATAYSNDHIFTYTPRQNE
jgi:hypothetical protein